MPKCPMPGRVRESLCLTHDQDRYPCRSTTLSLSLILILTRHPRPKYKRWRAILYGSFIDWAILLRLPLGDNIFGCIARHRGPEQIRLLLVLALFDADGDGGISEIELEKFDNLSDEIISDGKHTCVNLSIVSVMLLGLLHNVTIGRPVALAFGTGAEEQYGGWLLWLAYGLNLSGESGAFFTMCLSIITRNYLTNVLPTRYDRVDFLRTTNALGCMGSSMLITLWCFLLSSIVLALTTNPTLGLLGAGLLLVLLFAFMFFIAPLRYCGTMLLHEEVVHVLMKREEKRRSRASRASSYASSRAGSVPPSPSRPPPALASALPQRWQRLLPSSHAGSEWPGVGADLPLGLPSRALACRPNLVRRCLSQVCSPPKLGHWPGATAQSVLDDAAPHSVSSPPEPHQWSEHR